MNEDTNVMSDMDNMDLSSIDTGMPILPKGLYQATVLEVKKVESKNKPGQFLTTIKLGLAEVYPYTTADGVSKTTNVGFPIFDRISMTPTEKFDPRVTCARFQEGTIGKRGPWAPLEQYVGQSCTIRLDIESSEEYGNKNVVKQYLKKA